MKGADEGGSLYCEYSQWKKLFFHKPPLVFRCIPTCTHVNDRSERGKEKRGKKGREERGERRGERRDLKRYTQSTASDECRNQWPPCFPFTGPPYYETSPCASPWPIFQPLAKPRLNPCTRWYAHQRNTFCRQAAMHEPESAISIIITLLVAFAE